jgi:hypothetical protein
VAFGNETEELNLKNISILTITVTNYYMPLELLDFDCCIENLKDVTFEQLHL